jgi:DNA repair protein RAD5
MVNLYERWEDGDNTLYFGLLVAILRLRQLCNDPKLFLKESAKSSKTAKLVKAPTVTKKNVVDGKAVETIKKITCSICMDKINDEQCYRLGCGHHFCVGCIEEWRKQPRSAGNRCPLCRKEYEISESDLEKGLRRTPKTITMLKKCKQWADENHKTVVFSQWRSYFDLVQKYVSKVVPVVFRIDGTVTIHKRTDILEKFEKCETAAVLLITTNCGNVGLNLTCATRVLMLDPMYNPVQEMQAFSRVHRIGQTQPVEIVRVLTEDTVEEWMESMKQRKTATASHVYTGKAPTDSPTSKDIRELFKKFVY